MTHICPACHALHFITEWEQRTSRLHPVFTKCCAHQTIQLPPFQPLPNPLAQLMCHDSEDPNAKHFKENIQQYNHALSFVSLGAHRDEHVEGGGVYSYRIHGALHHRYGPARPNNDQRPVYNQLYFLDPEVAKQERERRNTNLKPQILGELGEMLEATHPYAGHFKHAFEVLQAQEQQNRVAGRPNEVVEVRIHFDPQKDQRRYNLPTVDEVAVVIPNGLSNERRDFVLHNRTDGYLTNMSTGNPAYMPLHYVLAFPHGEHGWHWNIPKVGEDDEGTRTRTSKNVTEMQYYRYRLHFRNLPWSLHLFRCGRLFQQFIVDAWVSVEQDRLNWIQHNQKTIRADLYNGLVDSVAHNDHDRNLTEIGKRVILPASFVSSARYMYQLYQDSMAIVR
ncbi:hypothetical protein CALVIDRAFT_481632 [Calocera viscosa TUFC12733]|uniref:Helitron helicase-like domain-containing protein n=1 Tax=Calocera viscosa (strain TUFC12733) TaxID=1330018 RepID=A0A167LYV5_CALVF|nr:hypothetical protein CALVIDRAFT_481632 [Calocera viscosa TUFC12733]